MGRIGLSRGGKESNPQCTAQQPTLDTLFEKVWTENRRREAPSLHMARRTRPLSSVPMAARRMQEVGFQSSFRAVLEDYRGQIGCRLNAPGEAERMWQFRDSRHLTMTGLEVDSAGELIASVACGAVSVFSVADVVESSAETCRSQPAKSRKRKESEAEVVDVEDDGNWPVEARDTRRISQADAVLVIAFPSYYSSQSGGASCVGPIKFAPSTSAALLHVGRHLRGGGLWTFDLEELDEHNPKPLHTYRAPTDQGLEGEITDIAIPPAHGFNAVVGCSTTKGAVIGYDSRSRGIAWGFPQSGGVRTGAATLGAQRSRDWTQACSLAFCGTPHLLAVGSSVGIVRLFDLRKATHEAVSEIQTASEGEQVSQVMQLQASSDDIHHLYAGLGQRLAVVDTAEATVTHRSERVASSPALYRHPNAKFGFDVSYDHGAPRAIYPSSESVGLRHITLPTTGARFAPKSSDAEPISLDLMTNESAFDEGPTVEPLRQDFVETPGCPVFSRILRDSNQNLVGHTTGDIDVLF